MSNVFYIPLLGAARGPWGETFHFTMRCAFQSSHLIPFLIKFSLTLLVGENSFDLKCFICTQHIRTWWWENDGNSCCLVCSAGKTFWQKFWSETTLSFILIYLFSLNCVGNSWGKRLKFTKRDFMLHLCPNYRLIHL